MACSLHFQLYCMRLFYPATASIDRDLRSRAVNDLRFDCRPRQLPKFKPPDDLSSAFRGAVAFTVSVLADVVSLALDQRKMNKWWQALIDFKGYLDTSGVGGEWNQAISKPLAGGRLLSNLKVLHDVQLKLYVERAKAIASVPDEVVHSAVLEGKRYVVGWCKLDSSNPRGAKANAIRNCCLNRCTAYGTEMVRSALDREACHDEIDDNCKAIAFHCGISADDIKILHVDEGGDMKVLRHFVAVDHATKSVVVALRGTLSISGALVDIQAMDTPFHGCRAHKGMAEMAENVWECSRQKIIELLQHDLYTDYTLIITGHSLGAGTACLLHLIVHEEATLEGREIRCFGFAPPPTVAFDDEQVVNKKLLKAVDNTICFVHDNDCVPFLSVSCVRRLAHLLDAVDNRTQYISAYRRFRIFWGWDSLPEDVVAAVKVVDADRSTDRDVKLSIPAKFIVWMKHRQDGSLNFDSFGCLPQDFADQNIFVCEDLLCDHLVEPYEDALDNLSTSILASESVTHLHNADS